ncbi:MAG: hypothetical protein HON94_01020 [Methylococcales bacterium]|jgi:hypothetical protein|nr:hypothetical protein [Methylococcales bacterium]MBT7410756.1 hypothetical protein [Methylococcales bacterium]
MERCDKCHEFLYPPYAEKHQCSEFTIIDEDGEQHCAYAVDEHSAALKYAEKSNQANDNYLANESVKITVNGTPFNISAEPSIEYFADEE